MKFLQRPSREQAIHGSYFIGTIPYSNKRTMNGFNFKEPITGRSLARTLIIGSVTRVNENHESWNDRMISLDVLAVFPVTPYPRTVFTVVSYIGGNNATIFSVIRNYLRAIQCIFVLFLVRRRTFTNAPPLLIFLDSVYLVLRF